MKVGIQQSILLKALERGAMAALSDGAQTDTSTMAPLIKAVKVTAKKDTIIIESSANLLAAKVKIPVVDKESLVKEEGTVLIPAKEFYNWVKIQGNASTINMSYKALSTPILLNTVGDAENDSNFSIKKIGSLSVVSKDPTKTTQRWKLDCYDYNDKPDVDFSQNTINCFDIDMKALENAIKYVSFAAYKKQDEDHILDNISFQVIDDKLFVATTDMHRVALYDFPSDTIEVHDKQNLLIQLKAMDKLLKLSDHTKLSFSYDKDNGRIFIKQPNFFVRLAGVAPEKIAEFSSVASFFKTNYKDICEISKSSFDKILATAALINSKACQFTFKKDDPKLIVRTISEEGNLPENRAETILTDNSTMDLTAVWGVQHLLEVSKVMESSNLKLAIPDRENNVRITGFSDENYYYYALRIKKSKYNDLNVAE